MAPGCGELHVTLLPSIPHEVCPSGCFPQQTYRVVWTLCTRPSGSHDDGSGPEEQLLRGGFNRYYIKGLRRREQLWSVPESCCWGKVWIRECLVYKKIFPMTPLSYPSLVEALLFSFPLYQLSVSSSHPLLCLGYFSWQPNNQLSFCSQSPWQGWNRSGCLICVAIWEEVWQQQHYHCPPSCWSLLSLPLASDVWH